MEWQPISTAPKDDGPIIVATRSHANGLAIVQWEPSVPHPIWMDDEGDSYFDATHWMPLRQPPTE
jgi:hypothetical protein